MRQADRSFRGVLTGVCICDIETSAMRRPTASLCCWAKGKKYKESLHQLIILACDIAKCIFQCVDYYNLFVDVLLKK